MAPRHIAGRLAARSWCLIPCVYLATSVLCSLAQLGSTLSTSANHDVKAASPVSGQLVYYQHELGASHVARALPNHTEEQPK